MADALIAVQLELNTSCSCDSKDTGQFAFVCLHIGNNVFCVDVRNVCHTSTW